MAIDLDEKEGHSPLDPGEKTGFHPSALGHEEGPERRGAGEDPDCRALPEADAAKRVQQGVLSNRARQVVKSDLEVIRREDSVPRAQATHIKDSPWPHVRSRQSKPAFYLIPTGFKFFGYFSFPRPTSIQTNVHNSADVIRSFDFPFHKRANVLAT